MNGPCGNRTHLNIRFAGPAATPCSPKARIYPACAGEQPNVSIHAGINWRDHDLRETMTSEVMNHLEMKLQRPDLNRHESPYEDAALPVEPLCIIRCQSPPRSLITFVGLSGLEPEAFCL